MAILMKDTMKIAGISMLAMLFLNKCTALSASLFSKRESRELYSTIRIVKEATATI